MKIYGYKVFGNNWSCKGYQYKFGENVHTGDLEIYFRGLHLCECLRDCFNYYGYTKFNRIGEVIVTGNYDFSKKDTTIVTDRLELVRELGWKEVREICESEKELYKVSGKVWFDFDLPIGR